MVVKTLFPHLRLRRLRQSPLLRSLVRETHLELSDLILPLFIKEDAKEKIPISSMPGHFQIPLSLLEREIEEIMQLGISSVILFGIPARKDAEGSSACLDFGVIQEATRLIKKITSTLLVITDVCLCEYTNHGHCGFVEANDSHFKIDNDATLNLLVRQAISHAKSGADVIAPSGMMDGFVKVIREGLDEAGFESLPILSYSVKYHSSFYGPFRLAAEGGFQFGDRSTHQMDPANSNEALREVYLDEQEGVDMLMIKPAHSYLDVIYKVKSHFPHIPLGAYHTSGEYAMIKAAAEKGWVDEKKATWEVLNSIKRAGADFIISYYTKEMARWQYENSY